MAEQTFTAILNAASFPFVSDFFQRPVIIPGIDNPTRTPKDYYGTQESINFELAQTYYCQDVVPVAAGVISAGYEDIIPTIGATDFDTVFVLRDADENNFLFVPARGQNYIYRKDVGMWVPTNSFSGWTGELVTRAYVNGRTFICYQRYGIFEYDTAANTFLPVTITGVDVTTIDGISNSSNYMLWWSGITVGWSSLVDPTDLTPSINTGAGSSIPQDVKGAIRAIVPVAGGFVIFTTKNAVGALYTNNARAPFVYKEISTAGGVESAEQVSFDAAGSAQFAWSSAGLQRISASQAEFVSAAATDFLAGRIYESFDTSTLTLTTERLTSDLKVKVAFLSSRYLAVSYGKESTPQIYTHVLLYDTALKRWGKLRVDHVDAFSYPYPNLIGEVTQTPPKQSVAFVTLDGTVKLLIMDYRIRSNNAVLMLGRYQLVRDKMITFQQMEIESVIQAYPPEIYLLNSLDGRNTETPRAPTLLRDSGNMRTYGARVTGRNFSVLFVGTFELSTVMFTITQNGKR